MQMTNNYTINQHKYWQSKHAVWTWQALPSWQQCPLVFQPIELSLFQQDSVWHDASRGPSVIAELLVVVFSVDMLWFASLCRSIILCLTAGSSIDVGIFGTLGFCSDQVNVLLCCFWFFNFIKIEYILNLFVSHIVKCLQCFVHQEEHPACKNGVMRCWCGYLSGARCALFAYGPADSQLPITPLSLASFKSRRLVLPLVLAYPGCPGKGVVVVIPYLCVGW